MTVIFVLYAAMLFDKMKMLVMSSCMRLFMIVKQHLKHVSILLQNRFETHTRMKALDCTVVATGYKSTCAWK